MQCKQVTKGRLLRLLFLLLLGLTACSGANLKVGWVERSGFNYATARYTTFDGAQRRNVDVELGETVTLNFDVTVGKGSLTLRILAPDDTAVWQRTFTNDDKGLVDVHVDRPGTYRIIIAGEQTGGSFDLQWQAR